MDNSYQVATSWIIFGSVVGAGLYYYWPADQRRADRNREDAQHRRRRNEQDTRGRQLRRLDSEQDLAGESSATDRSAQGGNENTRKRKVQTKEPAQPAPAVVVQADEPDEIDMSTKQWAEQMLKARKGADLTSTKSKETRVKTVKQSSAIDSPALSDDDAPPAQSSEMNAGDVSDMLEPVASGPSSMRITPATKPQKEKVARQPKQEVVETKKQRQNRQKNEERKLQQAADEAARKVLEEKQRRTAREARGEPARNGMQSAQAPANNAWTTKPMNGTSTAPAPTSAPLLDTFDVESNSSSNGGQASTAATSTSGGRQSWDLDLPSEEDQMAQAMRQSEDESGWTTVAQPKKQKQKKAAPVEAEPVLTNKTNMPTPKPTTNGKPIGFQALDVQYEQRTDADPNDASNWDA